MDLAAEPAVSRGTVRKAIAELIAEGLLIQTHGRGTFVAPHVVEQPLADRFVTFSEDLISKVFPFETRLLDQIVLTARGHVAALLQVKPGAKVLYLRRVRLVDEEPLILLHNYVVYAAAPASRRSISPPSASSRPWKSATGCGSWPAIGPSRPRGCRSRCPHTCSA